MKKALFLLLVPMFLIACAAKPVLLEPVPALPAPQIEASEPETRIQEPVFTITSIAVLQAELINTRFKVRLRIDNPNTVPLELSAFSYELYGADRLWAEGKETASKEDGTLLRIPPAGFAEKDLFLGMNFMSMNREVLDQIIALQTVRYRFSGDVTVTTGIESLPQFTLRFDLSGESPVVR